MLFTQEKINNIKRSERIFKNSYHKTTTSLFIYNTSSFTRINKSIEIYHVKTLTLTLTTVTQCFTTKLPRCFLALIIQKYLEKRIRSA